MSISLVKNIWAVGRNYADHAKEMMAEIPTEPFFFLKSGSCIETDSKFSLPEWSNNVQHELEIAFWIDDNLNFSHFTLALDLTARDAQNLAKTKGLPWTLSKSFKSACPMGHWIRIDEIGPLEKLQFELKINNLVAQKGFAQDMIFKPEQLLSFVKKHFPLTPYDVILTGTPQGVSTLKSGDSLDAVLQSDGRKILACHWDVI